VPGERLSQDEVARVLRRAAELDPETSPPVDEGVPVAALEAAASEVGLPPAAVRQAVAELRTGALDDDGVPVVCARVVPGSCAEIIATVGGWLHGQAMVRARDRGTEQVWRPREDWMAGVHRKLDFAAALRLKAVEEVVVRTVEVEGGTLVRLSCRLQPSVTRAPKVRGGIGASAGLATAALGVVDPLFLAAAVPVGAAGGTLGWRLGRSSLARHRDRVADAVDGVLDELELGRLPAASAAGRLAARARRLRTGYRL
jgi:hypothetical protein